MPAQSHPLERRRAFTVPSHALRRLALSCPPETAPQLSIFPKEDGPRLSKRLSRDHRKWKPERLEESCGGSRPPVGACLQAWTQSGAPVAKTAWAAPECHLAAPASPRSLCEALAASSMHHEPYVDAPLTQARVSLFAALPRLETAASLHGAGSTAPTPALSAGRTDSTSSALSCSSAHTPPESPIAHARRMPLRRAPSMRLTTSRSSHRLDIALPKPGGRLFAPEMVTIAALRGDRIDVVADAWDQEEDCVCFLLSACHVQLVWRGADACVGHFEWHIAFAPQSVDMGSIHAEFDKEGNLAIKVQRARSTGDASRPVVY
jgi:hypothetical protein